MTERATVKRYHKDGFGNYKLRNFYIDPPSGEEIEWGALPETFVDADDYEDLRSTYEAELLETEKDRNYWRSECLSKSQESDQTKRKLTLASYILEELAKAARSRYLDSSPCNPDACDWDYFADDIDRISRALQRFLSRGDAAREGRS